MKEDAKYREKPNVDEEEEVDDDEYEDLDSSENLFGKIIIRVRTFIFKQLQRVSFLNLSSNYSQLNLTII